jgi:hypothetical protein
MIHSNDAIPNTQYQVTSGSFTVPASATVNTVLRMRVMDDLTTAYGTPVLTSCGNPAYGQAEDYPIFLNALLPVVLTNFDGRLKWNNVTLNWSVSMQEKNKGFEIERSYDGVNFRSIGFVEASKFISAGNYMFRDDEIAQENNYYRLRQIDQDNHYEFSKVILVKSPKVFSATFKVLNNPFDHFIDVQFENIKTGKTEIRLLDIQGKEIIKKSQVINNVSRVRIELGAVYLEKGMFLLEVTSGNNKYVAKVLKN